VYEFFSGIRGVPAFAESCCVGFEECAVLDCEFDVSYEFCVCVGVVGELEGGGVEAAEVEVADYFGVEAVEEFVLGVEVGG